jgi:hypothetical protein
VATSDVLRPTAAFDRPSMDASETGAESDAIRAERPKEQISPPRGAERRTTAATLPAEENQLAVNYWQYTIAPQLEERNALSVENRVLSVIYPKLIDTSAILSTT